MMSLVAEQLDRRGVSHRHGEIVRWPEHRPRVFVEQSHDVQRFRVVVAPGANDQWNRCAVVSSRPFAIRDAGSLLQSDLSVRTHGFVFHAKAHFHRSALMAYKKDVAIDGVPAYRFGPPASMLDPKLPENRGFCNPHETQFFDNITQPGAPSRFEYNTVILCSRLSADGSARPEHVSTGRCAHFHVARAFPVRPSCRRRVDRRIVDAD